MNRISKNADIMNSIFDPLAIDRLLERVEKKGRVKRRMMGEEEGVGVGVEVRRRALVEMREKVERECREEEGRWEKVLEGFKNK